MLMHTKGILVMTPESAMVLTGKQALDYSGGVSAEDNFGIGGYERIMGPNGQAQYWAPDLAGACEILLAYYERTYVAPGERFPRRAETADPVDRDVRAVAARGAGLRPRHGRRDLLRGDQPGAQEAVRHPLGDARGRRRRPRAAGALGGHARGRGRRRRGTRTSAAGRSPMLGIESRPLPRFGPVPADGPGPVDAGHAVPAGLEQDRAGDQRRLRPPAARRARQPRRLRRLARVDAPAAARVRRRDRPRGRQLRRPDRLLRHLALPRRRVRRLLAPAQRQPRDDRARGRARVGDRRRAGRGGRVRPRGRRRARARTPRIAELDERIAAAEGAERERLRGERERAWAEVRSEKLGELAAEFDAIHSVERAVEVGSVDRIIAAAELRPYLIDAVERGMQRTLDGLAAGNGGRFTERLLRSPGRAGTGPPPPPPPS